MKLREITVSNFRAFGSASVTLPSEGLVLFAGANNAGKSALMSAIDIVAGLSVDTPALKHVASQLPPRITATFDLTDEERTEIIPPHPQKTQLISGGAGRRLQFEFETQVGQALRLKSVRGIWDKASLEMFATSGLFQQGTYQPKIAEVFIAPEQTQQPMLLVRRGPDSDQELSIGDFAGAYPFLSSLLQLFYSWRSRFYHFQALRVGTRTRTTGLKSDLKLTPTGENLPAVLLNMSTDRNVLFLKLRDLIAEIVPGIGELQIRTTGDLQITFTTREAELNLKDHGTGVEQLLMTLVVGLTEVPPFTLLIEEPETNLHPAAQRALLTVLKSWEQDRQILVATHSPVMLDWSPRGDRLWHVTRKGGHSRVAQVAEDPTELLDELGVRLSDVLSASRLLIVEGPSDVDVLSTWFPDVFLDPDVAVLSGVGGDNAQHADLFAEWLTAADRIGTRKALYLRDRDELSPSILQALENSPTVEVLPKRELENFLLDANAIVDVLHSIAPSKGVRLTAEEVASAMNEIAEAQRRRIIVNRVCRQIEPTNRLMDHKLRQFLAKEEAGEADIVNEVSGRLMTPDQLRDQISAAWSAAETAVNEASGDALLAIAPGEEILKALFTKFAGQGYSKRVHGKALAKLISPPGEIKILLNRFLAD